MKLGLLILSGVLIPLTSLSQIQPLSSSSAGSQNQAPNGAASPVRGGQDWYSSSNPEHVVTARRDHTTFQLLDDGLPSKRLVATLSYPDPQDGINNLTIIGWGVSVRMNELNEQGIPVRYFVDAAAYCTYARTGSGGQIQLHITCFESDAPDFRLFYAVENGNHLVRVYTKYLAPLY